MRQKRYPWLVAAALVAWNAVAEEGPAVTNTRTDWFKDARWGVFTHYMADTVLKGDEITVDNWNKAVDGYDVDALAGQLASIGAGYFVLTLGQNSGYYCSPNAAYDGFVGIQPSRCSKRDLVADLAAALIPKGIRLMVYLPSGAPDRDEVAVKALEWQNGKYPLWTHPEGGPDARLESFQRKWEAVIREWSTRWGKNVSGWWFDGCYFPDAMYRHPEPPNFESFAAAARAGNPDSIVAFNPGVRNPIIRLTPAEDYTAGEINEPQEVTCAGRWVDGAQFQMLSYLGPRWCAEPPRFSNQQVIDITRGIVEKGGVVTWDVPPAITGAIPEPFMPQLHALGEAMAR
ncbi:MAG TPA: alpha-L-fucosidase [Candidatus Hydrogenedentes bacterium]|nr:alpha-L-fucosidase [Candidatus Hydrogenedentota bacterium]HPG70271.1 alpha-L-fucosidase [Candidatus Hydrogenedentota bacterium]